MRAMMTKKVSLGSMMIAIVTDLNCTFSYHYKTTHNIYTTCFSLVPQLPSFIPADCPSHFRLAIYYVLYGETFRSCKLNLNSLHSSGSGCHVFSQSRKLISKQNSANDGVLNEDHKILEKLKMVAIFSVCLQKSDALRIC